MLVFKFSPWLRPDVMPFVCAVKNAWSYPTERRLAAEKAATSSSKSDVSAERDLDVMMRDLSGSYGEQQRTTGKGEVVRHVTSYR